MKKELLYCWSYIVPPPRPCKLAGESNSVEQPSVEVLVVVYVVGLASGLVAFMASEMILRFCI